MVVIGGGADEEEAEEEEEEVEEDRDEAIIDACRVCGLRESVRPGYPNTARVADSPPEKAERAQGLDLRRLDRVLLAIDRFSGGGILDCEGWRL